MTGILVPCAEIGENKKEVTTADIPQFNGVADRAVGIIEAV